MLKGRCLCGSVRYRIDGKLGAIVYCHCRECRKSSGSSFGTTASVVRAELTFERGESELREFESSPGQFRCFCGACGSPILKRFTDKPEEVRIRLGCLDDDPGNRPVAHVLVSEKAPWTEILDDLPQAG